MKQYVVGFIFDPQMEHVLLLQRAKAPYKGLWNGIGGKIEPGESPEHAMVREYEEETEMKADECLPFKKLATITLEGIELHAFYSIIKQAPFIPQVTSTIEGNLEWLHIEMNALLQANNPMLAGEGNIPYFLHLANIMNKREENQYETRRPV